MASVQADHAVLTVRAPVRPAALPLTVALAAVASVLVFTRGDGSVWGLVVAVAAAVLVWLAAIDFEVHLIPNRIVLPATAAVLALAFALDPSRGVEHAVAALGLGAILLLAALLRPGALGMGDVKLGLLLGALLGANVIDACAIGFVLLAGAAFFVVARDGRSALKRHLPLAPFLAAGAIATLILS